MKTVYLTENPSLELMRLGAYPRPSAPSTLAIGELACRARGIRDIRLLLRVSSILPLLPLPYRIFVPAKADRRPSKLVNCQVIPPVRGGVDFIELDECCKGLSPEMTYILFCRAKPLALRAQLGLELCGTYATAPEHYPEMATQYDLEPLTNVSSITAALERFVREPDSIAARQALHYVQNKSASPMESALLLLLCLPPAEGGYGLPIPELNADLPIIAYLGQQHDEKTRYGDLVYREAQLVLEYQSLLYHDEPGSKHADEDRRDDIEAMGYTVMFITPERLQDFDCFEGIVQRIAHHLGLAPACVPLGLTPEKRSLRRLLLPASWNV